MKKRSICAVFEFFQRDDETDEEALEVAKSCIECSIGHVEEIKIADTDSINQDVGTKKSPMHPLKEPSGDMFSRAWWFKCPVCHEAIDYQQRMCDLCLQPINWDGEQGQWG